MSHSLSPPGRYATLSTNLSSFNMNSNRTGFNPEAPLFIPRSSSTASVSAAASMDTLSSFSQSIASQSSLEGDEINVKSKARVMLPPVTTNHDTPPIDEAASRYLKQPEVATPTCEQERDLFEAADAPLIHFPPFSGRFNVEHTASLARKAIFLPDRRSYDEESTSIEVLVQESGLVEVRFPCHGLQSAQGKVTSDEANTKPARFAEEVQLDQAQLKKLSSRLDPQALEFIPGPKQSSSDLDDVASEEVPEQSITESDVLFAISDPVQTTHLKIDQNHDAYSFQLEEASYAHPDGGYVQPAQDYCFQSAEEFNVQSAQDSYFQPDEAAYFSQNGATYMQLDQVLHVQLDQVHQHFEQTCADLNPALPQYLPLGYSVPPTAPYMFHLQADGCTEGAPSQIDGVDSVWDSILQSWTPVWYAPGPGQSDAITQTSNFSLLNPEASVFCPMNPEAESFKSVWPWGGDLDGKRHRFYPFNFILRNELPYAGAQMTLDDYEERFRHIAIVETCVMRLRDTRYDPGYQELTSHHSAATANGSDAGHDSTEDSTVLPGHSINTQLLESDGDLLSGVEIEGRSNEYIPDEIEQAHDRTQPASGNLTDLRAFRQKSAQLHLSVAEDYRLHTLLSQGPSIDESAVIRRKEITAAGNAIESVLPFGFKSSHHEDPLATEMSRQYYLTDNVNGFHFYNSETGEVEACTSVHHFSFLGFPLPAKCDTSPATSLAIICGTAKLKMGINGYNLEQGGMRRGVLLYNASLYVDPVVYYGNPDDIDRLKGSELENKAIGLVKKAYSARGNWRMDHWDLDEHIPEIDPMNEEQYEEDELYFNPVQRTDYALNAEASDDIGNEALRKKTRRLGFAVVKSRLSQDVAADDLPTVSPAQNTVFGSTDDLQSPKAYSSTPVTQTHVIGHIIGKVQDYDSQSVLTEQDTADGPHISDPFHDPSESDDDELFKFAAIFSNPGPENSIHNDSRDTIEMDHAGDNVSEAETTHSVYPELTVSPLKIRKPSNVPAPADESLSISPLKPRKVSDESTTSQDSSNRSQSRSSDQDSSSPDLHGETPPTSESDSSTTGSLADISSTDDGNTLIAPPHSTETALTRILPTGRAMAVVYRPPPDSAYEQARVIQAMGYVPPTRGLVRSPEVRDLKAMLDKAEEEAANAPLPDIRSTQRRVRYYGASLTLSEMPRLPREQQSMFDFFNRPAMEANDISSPQPREFELCSSIRPKNGTVPAQVADTRRNSGRQGHSTRPQTRFYTITRPQAPTPNAMRYRRNEQRPNRVEVQINRTPTKSVRFAEPSESDTEASDNEDLPALPTALPVRPKRFATPTELSLDIDNSATSTIGTALPYPPPTTPAAPQTTHLSVSTKLSVPTPPALGSNVISYFDHNRDRDSVDVELSPSRFIMEETFRDFSGIHPAAWEFEGPVGQGRVNGFGLRDALAEASTATLAPFSPSSHSSRSSEVSDNSSISPILSRANAFDALKTVKQRGQSQAQDQCQPDTHLQRDPQSASASAPISTARTVLFRRTQHTASSRPSLRSSCWGSVGNKLQKKQKGSVRVTTASVNGSAGAGGDAVVARAAEVGDGQTGGGPEHSKKGKGKGRLSKWISKVFGFGKGKGKAARAVEG